MTGDKSTKVGGRRVKGPAAPKASMVNKPGGKKVMCDGGRKGYLAGKCR